MSWSRSTDRPTCTTRSGACRRRHSIASRAACRKLQAAPARPRTIVRSVVQRVNHACLAQTIEPCAGSASIAVVSGGRRQLDGVQSSRAVGPATHGLRWRCRAISCLALAHRFARSRRSCRDALEPRLRRREASPRCGGFTTTTRALAGQGAFPARALQCALDVGGARAGGRVRPCFFHAAYPVQRPTHPRRCRSTRRRRSRFAATLRRQHERHVPALRLLAVTAGVGRSAECVPLERGYRARIPASQPLTRPRGRVRGCAADSVTSRGASAPLALASASREWERIPASSSS